MDKLLLKTGENLLEHDALTLYDFTSLYNLAYVLYMHEIVKRDTVDSLEDMSDALRSD